MVAIDVDFEVFKQLTVRRRAETMTENEVLRELLGLAKVKNERGSADSGGTAWVSKGVSFAHDTEFRGTYKGKQYTGTVRNGALVLNGRRYSSPSAAAISITGNPVNGWRFWECLPPGATTWKLIADLRR